MLVLDAKLKMIIVWNVPTLIEMIWCLIVLVSQGFSIKGSLPVGNVIINVMAV